MFFNQKLFQQNLLFQLKINKFLTQTIIISERTYIDEMQFKFAIILKIAMIDIKTMD